MFANISIKNKVLFLVLIPIIFLTIISLRSINFDYENVQKLKNLENGVILSTLISTFVHETQKERGMSAVYLSKINAKSKIKLSSQMKLTNEKLNELKLFIKNNNEQVGPQLCE
ncbi:MAG: nitrate- and nitrite sensing domain-containing protein [Campylobacteraceae bacterium]|nr:nitrate- and nitrite sensing domain-containing protein [Campylobacteraceae bacterium]